MEITCYSPIRRIDQSLLIAVRNWLLVTKTPNISTSGWLQTSYVRGGWSQPSYKRQRSKNDSKATNGGVTRTYDMVNIVEDTIPRVQDKRQIFSGITIFLSKKNTIGIKGRQKRSGTAVTQLTGILRYVSIIMKKSTTKGGLFLS